MTTDYLRITDNDNPDFYFEISTGMGGIRLIIGGRTNSGLETLLKFWLNPEDVPRVIETLQLLQSR